jgi:regulator of nucleoside diphosphate kinase
MKKLKNKLVLTRDDHKLLTTLLNARWGKTAFDRKNNEDMKLELQKATVVHQDSFPPDVVRLNSEVTITADDKHEIMELKLVAPHEANIKEKKISILAPIGAALIGFRQGEKIKWRAPAGNRIFTILKVINQFS